MDYNFVSFYQGTDNNTDPSYGTINVLYDDGSGAGPREICYSTSFLVDISIAYPSSDFDSIAESIAQGVQLDCSPTIDNPSYDAMLTACWT